MLTYRRIEKELHWPKIIWEIEATFPLWFRAASHAWTKSLEELQAFWAEVDEVYGLFDDREPDKLLACVYLELFEGNALNIHISMLEKVDPKAAVRFFLSLKQQKALDGYRRMTGWISSRNPILKLAADAGWKPTGLEMRYGSMPNGKSIRWLEVVG